MHSDGNICSFSKKRLNSQPHYFGIVKEVIQKYEGAKNDTFVKIYEIIKRHKGIDAVMQ